MSKPSPIPFKDLNFDAAATAAQRVTQAHNIPTLAFPEGRAGGSPAHSAVPSPAPVPALEPETSRSPTKTLKVALPLAAIAHIKRRMVNEQVTQQYILMEALQKGGIPIDDADMSEDGRRDR